MTKSKRTTLFSALAAAMITSGAFGAESLNPKTDWFQHAGYGVFVHYLTSLQNDPERVHSLGKQTSWDECVREFDTERFADAMAEAGAGYVIFTVMQVSRFMIAPNATFDRISGYTPGEACATRDLIEDLYQSLHRHNIPLMLYWTGDGPRADEKAGPAYGCGTPVSKEFVQKWADTFREYGERYGDKVAGIWCDGSYSFIGYDQEKLGILAQGLRAGNPNRILALNPGVDPEVRAYTPHEDYTCGEQNVFAEVPVQRFLNGEQWHILSFLSKTWWGEPGTGYSKRELADYVFDVTQRGGVVSIDVALFRDGSLDRSQIEVLKAVRRELREGKARIPVPPGNKAYRKQAKLLSLDGSRTLAVNGGTHFPRLGVDGKPDTVAQAAGEWPWTYEVDLIDTLNLKRIKVNFGSGYATQFELRISTDRKEWKTVAQKSDHDGKPFEAAFDPLPARYVRVCAQKPDGPDQPGAQMAIAELEVYE
ncbi:MAG TPA: alpha-L-fucosidase [Candidatus Hydrogenedentes bacterium]|nr:alpha-L-fucosidase [Candidatus Hydrogenedentota bacterium]